MRYYLLRGLLQPIVVAAPSDAAFADFRVDQELNKYLAAPPFEIKQVPVDLPKCNVIQISESGWPLTNRDYFRALIKEVAEPGNGSRITPDRIAGHFTRLINC